MAITTEQAFETAIEAWLLDHAGYEKADNSQFDTALALDSRTLLAFIKAAQPETNLGKARRQLWRQCGTVGGGAHRLGVRQPGAA